MNAKRSYCLSTPRHFHPSKSEAEYCLWLYARKQHGEIKNYSLYPSVPLTIAGKPWKKWKIDFMVHENDGTVSFHENKGWNRSDDSFKLKRDVFLIVYPHIKLYVNKEIYTGKVNRKNVRWRLSDVVRKNKKAAKTRKLMLLQREKQKGI